jgi:hypothetical protein
MSLYALSLVATLVGCGGEEKPAEAKPEPAAVVNLDELKKSAEKVSLVPSPTAMHESLKKAGVNESLDALVPDRTLGFEGVSPDIAAVKTGVALADTLLTVRNAPSEKLAARLGAVKSGMKVLKTGTDIERTIDDVTQQVMATAPGGREATEQEIEQLLQVMIPEVEYEAGEQIVPLLQAGAWLEGSNLIAAAILKANKPEAGTELLRQGPVCDYFLKYVDIAGKAKTNDAVVEQLRATLTKLKEISAKPALTIEDVQEVKKQTDTVLGML